MLCWEMSIIRRGFGGSMLSWPNRFGLGGIRAAIAVVDCTRQASGARSVACSSVVIISTDDSDCAVGDVDAGFCHQQFALFWAQRIRFRSDACSHRDSASEYH